MDDRGAGAAVAVVPQLTPAERRRTWLVGAVPVVLALVVMVGLALAGRATCGACGYDLAARPLFRCEERHQPYVESGLCDCGRRLQPVVRPRGLDRELRRTLWAGVWVAAFLVGVVLLLPVLG